MTTDQHTLDELQQALAMARQDREELARLIDERKAVEKERLLDELLARAAALGIQPGEFLDPLVKRMGPKKPRSLRYVDPGNPENVYVCGPTPAWLKANMRRDGFDPDVLAQRIDYRQKHLLIEN